MGLNQTKQAEYWVLGKPTISKCGFCTNRTEKPNLVINQTEQTKMWVLNIPNRLNLGIGQADQTRIWGLPRQNRPHTEIRV